MRWVFPIVSASSPSERTWASASETEVGKGRGLGDEGAVRLALETVGRHRRGSRHSGRRASATPARALDGQMPRRVGHDVRRVGGVNPYPDRR
jgi:hypothetical protein